MQGMLSQVQTGNMDERPALQIYITIVEDYQVPYWCRKARAWTPAVI